MKKAAPGAGKALIVLALILIGVGLSYFFFNRPTEKTPTSPDDEPIEFDPVVLTRDGSALFTYGIVTDIDLNAFSMFDIQQFPLVLHFEDGYDKPGPLSGGDFGREVYLGMIPDANDPAEACPMRFKNSVSYEVKGWLDPDSCTFYIALSLAIDETTLEESTCPPEVDQYANLTGISMAPVFLLPQFPSPGITISPDSYDQAVGAYVLNYKSTGAGGTITWSYTLENIKLPEAHPCSSQYFD